MSHKADRDIAAKLNMLGLMCPSCGGPLALSSGWICQRESMAFTIENGIADFLLPDRRTRIESFLSVYQRVRLDEGWGSTDIGYYLSLPWTDLSGKHRPIWRMRARAYERFREDLTSRYRAAPLRILDAGAGNCWLALKLGAEGHEVVAVDVNVDPNDGLGVLPRFPRQTVEHIYPVRAEFNHLPFPKGSFDVIVFNASLHYTKSPFDTVSHMLKFLKSDGSLYIMDSPIYSDPRSGDAMVTTRQAEIGRRHGMTSLDDFNGSYLTPDSFDNLSRENRVRTIKQGHAVYESMLRAIKGVLLGREPARMDIVVIEPL